MPSKNTNKQTIKQSNRFLPPRVNIFENSSCAKNIQVQLEIDTIGKWCVPVVYIGGIITALCARIFDAQVFLVKKIPPWGKLLQFSWVNGCYIVIVIYTVIFINSFGLKCNRITLFITFYSQIHHIYAYLHDKEV